MFAIEHSEGVVPDMITLGKAITAGYGTLGAVLVHERVSAHFDEEILACGLTHYAHPLAVAAGVAAFDVYESEELPGRAASMETSLLSGLAEIHKQCGSSVVRTRAIGLLGALDLQLNEESWAGLKSALRRRRVHVHINARIGTMVVSPPLCITEQELKTGCQAIADAIREAGA